MGMIENFEKMLAGGKDSPLLRFSLGNEYMKATDSVKASGRGARCGLLGGVEITGQVLGAAK
jgi:hypothetical protein